MQGARSAETGMYKLVHEDFEHRATLQTPSAAIFKTNGETMTINHAVRIIAGFFILLSLGLAHFNGQADLSRLSWLWFTAFVGMNLLQSGFTNWCPMDKILARCGLKQCTDK
jgi:hypothetical protein